MKNPEGSTEPVALRQTARKPLRVALIGWGAIARRFLEIMTERNAAGVEICGICLNANHRDCEIPVHIPTIVTPEALAGLNADVVIEAAGRDAVAQWGEAALMHARAFVVASTSAFTDDALLDRLIRVAEEHRSQLVIPPGALGGIDALAAAAALPLATVRHSIIKPPPAWRGTGAETLIDLDALSERKTFFVGSAREAARRFPQNANVAAISALAGVGLDRTRIELVADPGALRNQHVIHAEGDFGRLDVAIESRPLPGNPKSSEMTALGLVHLVENRFRPLAH